MNDQAAANLPIELVSVRDRSTSALLFRELNLRLEPLEELRAPDGEEG